MSPLRLLGQHQVRHAEPARRNRAGPRPVRRRRVRPVKTTTKPDPVNTAAAPGPLCRRPLIGLISGVRTITNSGTGRSGRHHPGGLDPHGNPETDAEPGPDLPTPRQAESSRDARLQRKRKLLSFMAPIRTRPRLPAVLCRPTTPCEPHTPHQDLADADARVRARRPFDDGGRFSQERVIHRPLDHPRTPGSEPRRFPQARIHRPPCTPSPPCQRRDETGSCQRYPHEFTGIHRKLSPAVDNLFRSYAQMWTRPGETDVDRHRESPSSPQPVETCGLPVEGSGDDEAVASQRYPQAWG